MNDPLSLSDSLIVHMSPTATIYKFRINDRGDWVAVKLLRAIPDARCKIIVRHCSSMIQLDNICAVFMREAQIGKVTVPVIVSEWFENINEYVRNHPHVVNKLRLVQGLAATLSSLHSAGVVHGNIHPGNVLVTPAGQVLVSDVGLDIHTRQLTLDLQGRIPIPYNWKYKSREELGNSIDGATIRHTTAMDVYTFAVTVYEIFNGNPPFRSLNASQGVLYIRTHGHSQLKIPAGMSRPTWELLGRCWEWEPSNRPDMAEVSNVLGNL